MYNLLCEFNWPVLHYDIHFKTDLFASFIMLLNQVNDERINLKVIYGDPKMQLLLSFFFNLFVISNRKWIS